jgi:tetratricopeptide (TPR) repeat protein
VAVRLAGSATPHERELISAMAVRYAHASQARETAPMAAAVCGGPATGAARVHPLDTAYAERLRSLLQARPDDPDLVVLWVEAAMIANPSLSWPVAGGTVPEKLHEMVDTLERALRQHPSHTGLNHYMIHAADHPSVAQRAVPAAERIGSLAPGAPHLVHMPAHTFAHVGRYADAARVNEQALQAEQAYHAQARAQGFVPMDDWRYHNQHFLWFAELMQGRGDAALAAARRNAELFGRGADPYLEYVRSLPLLTLVRLERWQDVLKEPAPEGASGIAQALALSARGVAQARLGRLEEAKSALEQLETHAEGVREGKTTRPGQAPPFVRAAADLSLGLLQAEVAAAEGRWDTAEVRLEQALRAAAPFDRYEPAMFGAGMRVALGELLLRAGKPERADLMLRVEMIERPDSGWALRGLAQAARARQQPDRAAAFERDLDRVWARADTALRRTP